MQLTTHTVALDAADDAAMAATAAAAYYVTCFFLFRIFGGCAAVVAAALHNRQDVCIPRCTNNLISLYSTLSSQFRMEAVRPSNSSLSFSSTLFVFSFRFDMCSSRICADLIHGIDSTGLFASMFLVYFRC